MECIVMVNKFSMHRSNMSFLLIYTFTEHTYPFISMQCDVMSFKLELRQPSKILQRAFQNEQGKPMLTIHESGQTWKTWAILLAWVNLGLPMSSSCVQFEFGRSFQPLVANKISAEQKNKFLFRSTCACFCQHLDASWHQLASMPINGMRPFHKVAILRASLNYWKLTEYPHCGKYLILRYSVSF